MPIEPLPSADEKIASNNNESKALDYSLFVEKLKNKSKRRDTEWFLFC